MKQSIHSFFWLVVREIQEHKGSFVLTPLVISGVFLMLTILAAGWGVMNADATVVVGGQQAKIMEGLAQGYIFSAVPLLAALPFVMMSYALGSLHDERKNKSILFWKSLPLSDAAIVGSKMAAGCVASPLIFGAVALLHCVATLIIAWTAGLLSGFHLSGVWMMPETYAQLGVVCSVMGWMMMAAFPVMSYFVAVSSLSNRPFLMAVLVPVLTSVVVISASKLMGWDVHGVWSWMSSMFLGIIPFTWQTMEPIAYSFSVVTGTLCLIGATRARKYTCS